MPGYADPIDADQWPLIFHSINYLIIWVAFAVNGALSLALGHAIIPSLVESHDAPRDIYVFRRFLYPIGIASLLLALFSAYRGLSLAVPIVYDMFPRLVI